MKHFVLTRFNVGRPDADEWFEERANLFERYTLPSIKAQTAEDFTWLVLFDEHSDDSIRSKVDIWRHQCQQFVPLGLNGDAAWDAAWHDRDNPVSFTRSVHNAIASRCEVGEHVITTRMDNDDALHREYLFRVQGVAKASHPQATIIVFLRGNVLWPAGVGGPNPLVKSVRFCTNMFLSLSEKMHDNLMTCWKQPHHEWRNGPLPIRNVDMSEPMWTWTRHGGNASKFDRIQGRTHCTEKRVLEAFS